MRREIYYEGPGQAWSRRHRAWLASLRFADRASQLTIADYLHSHDVLVARRETIEDELSKLAVDSPCAVAISRLRCLRGIDTLSALGLCAEIGEWDRFDHPDQLSAYLGIVPSEHTTSPQRRQGSITKAGATHARRLLIEASYHYRRDPGVSEPLERRQHGPASRDHQHRVARATPSERPLAPAQRRPQEAERDRGGRDRPRACRLLLGDRHLEPSGPCSASIIHTRRATPRANTLRPAQARARHDLKQQPTTRCG